MWLESRALSRSLHGFDYNRANVGCADVLHPVGPRLVPHDEPVGWLELRGTAVRKLDHDLAAFPYVSYESRFISRFGWYSV